MKKININSLRETFKELELMLENERDSQPWLLKIKEINEILSSSMKTSLSDQESFSLAAKKYRAIHTSHGGFSDYFIWRDDYELRNDLNQKLESFATKAWKDLELV